MSEPKEIWKTVEDGAIMAGDQLFYDCAWHDARPEVIGVRAISSAHRRRETIHTWTPRYDDPSKCGDGKRDILLWLPASDSGRAGYFAGTASCWFDGQAWFEMPPAPAPPKTAAEVAFEKVELQKYAWPSDKVPLIKTAFMQGYEAAQKEGK